MQEASCAICAGQPPPHRAHLLLILLRPALCLTVYGAAWIFLLGKRRSERVKQTASSPSAVLEGLAKCRRRVPAEHKLSELSERTYISRYENGETFFHAVFTVPQSPVPCVVPWWCRWTTMDGARFHAYMRDFYVLSRRGRFGVLSIHTP